MDDAMTKDLIDGTREVMQELTGAVRDLLQVVKERELHPAGLVSGMEVRQAIVSLTNELQKQAEWAYRNRAASAVANELEALRRRVEEMDKAGAAQQRGLTKVVQDLDSRMSTEIEALRCRAEGDVQSALSRTMKTVAEHETALRGIGALSRARDLGAIQFPDSGASSGG